jgi:putative DNA primase/helicase
VNGPESYFDDIETRAEQARERVKKAGKRKKSESGIDLKNPLATANAYRAHNMAGDHCVIRYSKGQFFTWNGSTYDELSEDHIRERAYAYLASERPTRRATGDFVDALKAAAHVGQEAPCWLDGATGPDPLALLPMRNGLVDLRNRKLIEPTAALFVHNGLAFDYVTDAPEPLAWLDFLSTIWPDDPDSISTLQEFIGLATLTSDTSHQKALLLVGPKRSGKGTIMRVAAALAGASNVCSPTLVSLGTHFGLQSLIGKRLALLSDARVSGKADMALIAESLLRITGEDAVTVPRKHIVDWHGRLPTRFWIASNELPSFVDASSALTSRFILMRMTRSFYGAEDHSLESRLLAELPGVLLWAMDGLDRLRARGRFVQPKSGAGLAAELDRMASPIGAFVREQCTIEVGAKTLVSELFKAWVDWCRDAGQNHTDTSATFAKKLYAAYPEITVSQPREFNQKRTFVGIRFRRATDTNHWHGAPADTADTCVQPLRTHAREENSTERNGHARVSPVSVDEWGDVA